MRSLFPNIKEALRGTLVKEEMPVQNQQQKDPMDAMDPRTRQNYLNELTKLDTHEEQLRVQIDKVKQQKADLKKKYNLPI
jgi:uncharacterized protein YaaW (UPF0174 family)